MRSLDIADDEAWWTVLGIVPADQADAGDAYVREVVYPVNDDGETVHVTWHEVDASVRIRHRRGDAVVTDLYREMATLLTVARDGGSAVIILEYGAAGQSGRTRVRLAPEVLVEDAVLRS